MAVTFRTASAVALAALLAVSAADAARASRPTSHSSEDADSNESDAVKPRQLFGLGPGSLFPNSPFGGLPLAFPFLRPGNGPFSNPLFNGGQGGQGGQFPPNAPGGGQGGQYPTNSPGGGPSPGFGANPFPNNQFGNNNPQGGGEVQPRPDQIGNQYNPGGQFAGGQVPNGNGNQFNPSAPTGNGGIPGGDQFNPGRPISSGGIPNGNGNQFNSGRPFGSGGIPNGNGNQFNPSSPIGNGGIPSGDQYNPGRPISSGGIPNGNGNQFNPGSPIGNGGIPSGDQYNPGRPISSGGIPSGDSNQFNPGRPTGNGGVPSGDQYNPGRPINQLNPGAGRPVGAPGSGPFNQGPQQTPVGMQAGAGRPGLGGQQVQRDLLVNPQECGIREEDRIIGGNLTAVMELPWMARLGYRSKRGGISYRCGGSLINHRYVLTAAHCVGDGDDPVEVRLGEHDEDSERDCTLSAGTTVCAPPVVDVRVERVIRNPQYSSDSGSPNYLKNDIALLRLASPVRFTEAVKPICLPESGVQVQAPTGAKAVVAGWGKDRNRGSTGTRYLLKASVPLWSVAECARVYESKGVRVGPTQVCAGGHRGVDSCQGDSGGPLYRAGLVREQPRAVQIGVVSFGLKDCATEGVPGVYTRVQSHMPWIVSNLAP